MSNAARAARVMSTEAVLRKHLNAAKIGVDALLEDYTEQSVMITHDAEVAANASRQVHIRDGRLVP